MRKNHAIMAAIFIASLSSISYEITLTRVFSISLWYHFAFMIISIAMLGIGASGTLLAVYPGLKKEQNLAFFFLMFCVSIPLSYLMINAVPFDPARLSWDRTQIFYVSLYYVLLSLPFFSFGLIIATAFSALSESAATIYGSDLTGAGAGSMLTLLLLSLGDAGTAVFIISAMAALSLLVYGNKMMKMLACLLTILYVIIAYIHPPFIDIKISPYKPLETSLRFPGAKLLKTYFSPFSRVDIFTSPAVRFAPGLSFRYLEELPQQTGISVDAAEVFAVTRSSDKTALGFLEYLPSSLPYLMYPQNSVLVIEPKGGLSVLTAEYFGAGDIYKADSNPLVIKAVREYLGGFSPGIYDDKTWTGMARSRLTSQEKGFDLIDVSVMGPLPSGSFGFSEDYRFTVEAFEEYIKHLTPDGMLSLNLFIIPPPRTELRLINTLGAAAENMGIKDFGRHVAAIRSWGTITIVIKRSVMTDEDLRRLKDFAREKRFDLVYYPGITEPETNIYVKMPSNEYYEAFRNLISPDTRKKFTDEYLFDIRPVGDEKPFFHYFLRMKNLGETYRLMGEKWQYFIEEGYLLPVIFLQVLLLSALLIMLPAVKFRRTTALTLDMLRSLSYFAFLGIGFMFIEISFIQKMILPLENPPYALSAVLASMLISSGTGSLLSERYAVLRSARILPLLSAILLAYGLFLSHIMNVIYPYPLFAKIISVFFILLPAGILMGIPFPLGLSLLAKSDQALIPWAWAINGCFSVMAPVLAIMLALSAGFQTVIITGVAMYMMAFLVLRR